MCGWVCLRVVLMRRAVYLALIYAQGGRTALMYAATEGRVDCVRLLLDADADTDAVDSVRGGLRGLCLLCVAGAARVLHSGAFAFGWW